MTVLELTCREAKSLYGILLDQKRDLEDLIKQETNEMNKKELEEELNRVNSIIQKLK